MQLHHSGTFYKGVQNNLQGPFFPKEPYEVGTVHRADLDTSTARCAPGIHVCWTIAEALRWGPRVVEVHLGAEGTVVINGKVRVGPSVQVTRIDVQVGAYLRDANLRDAYLAGVDLRGAYLARADLRGAYLGGANLTDANLAGAALTGAYLTGADLTGAYLGDANLAGVDLTDADLTDADFTGVDLTGAQGAPASGMPGGWRLDNAGSWTRSR